MSIAPAVFRAVLEPRHEACKLLHRFLVNLPALLRGRKLRFAENPCFGVAARPGDQRRRPRGEEVDPVERTLFLVEADRAVLDQVLADVIAVEVEIERRLELAGVGAAAGEL